MKEQSDSEDEMFIQTLFEEVEFPADKYKWLNRQKDYFKKHHCFVVSPSYPWLYNVVAGITCFNLFTNLYMVMFTA